jgi:hypothetical protein
LISEIEKNFINNDISPLKDRERDKDKEKDKDTKKVHFNKTQRDPQMSTDNFNKTVNKEINKSIRTELDR